MAEVCIFGAIGGREGSDMVPARELDRSEQGGAYSYVLLVLESSC